MLYDEETLASGSQQIRTAAIQAAQKGRADDLRRLLQRDSTLLTPEDNALALLATESMSIPTLQVLLDHGWDINLPESYLEPPYMGAIRIGGSEDLIRWFLDHGADPNAYAGVYAVTPLSRAVQFASFAIVQLLFQYGGQADQGELLNFACKRKPEDQDTMQIIQTLLEMGAPANHLLFEDIPDLVDVTMFNGTPLWSCCVTGNSDAVRLLLQHGANPWKKPPVATDFPIDLARKNGYYEIVKLLSEAMRLVPMSTA